MRKTLLMLMCCAISIYAQSQNLIRNGSFEELLFPADYYNGLDIGGPIGIGNSKDWSSTTGMSTHLHYKGYQYYNYMFPCVTDPDRYVHSGNGSVNLSIGELQIYAYPLASEVVFFNDYPNQLRQKLVQPLTAGCAYEVSAYFRPFTEKSYTFWDSAFTSPVSYCDSFFTAAVSNLGFYFSAQPTTNALFIDSATGAAIDTYYYQYYSPQNITPQIVSPAGVILNDTTGWYHLTGTYIAQGGEQYLTIGNFDRLDSLIRHLQYLTYGSIGFIGGDTVVDIQYMVDDVSLIPLTLPPAPSLALGADIYHCDSNPFSDVLTAAAGFDSYLWSTGDTTPSITATQPGIYWCRGSYGCGWLEDSVVIYNPQLFNTILPADTTLCNGQPLFSFQPSIPLPNYSWSTGDTTSYAFLPAPGIHTLTTTNICGSFTDTFQIDTTAFVFQAIVHDVVFCPSVQDSAVLQSSAAIGASYEWNDGDNSFNKTVQAEGTYWVKATRPCEITVDTFIVKCPVDTTGINSINGILADISIYPNPANNFVTLDYKAAGTLEIADLFGRVLIKQALNTAVQKQQLSTAALPSGTYFWRYRTDRGKTTTGKLLILKP